MQATSCPDSEQLLSYLSGTLAEAQSRTVATHLETCAGCRATVAALACRQGELETRLPDAAAGHAPANPSFVRPEVVSDIPNELGEYRILQKLGEGGMGAVYKAVHTRLDKIVALKTLPASQKGNEWIESRFDREMKAIGRLDHPNIVHAYDAREIAGTRFLVMEYVDGMDLWAVVDRCAPLAIADACELARQTALGLQAAHEQGLVHRDIKPSNLMLTRQGQVKILDLGLARFREGWTPAGETTSAGQIMGTADYIAPEQVSDSHNVDIRADIYSLGCTLYCLLTGEPPFGGGEYQGFVEKVMAHVLKPTPSIRERRGELSETLAAVVDRMLAKRPIERFAVPRDVTEALTPVCWGLQLGGTLDPMRGSHEVVGRDTQSEPSHRRSVRLGLEHGGENSLRRELRRRWRTHAGETNTFVFAAFRPKTSLACRDHRTADRGRGRFLGIPRDRSPAREEPSIDRRGFAHRQRFPRRRRTRQGCAV